MKSMEQIVQGLEERWKQELTVRFKCPVCHRAFAAWPGQYEALRTDSGSAYYKTICPGCGETIVKL